MTTPHGYNRYTHGCRCEVCRAGKADYMRAKRAAARANADDWTRAGYRHVAEDVQHGTQFAYDELGCRCDPCIDAKREHWRRWYHAKRDQQAAS